MYGKSRLNNWWGLIRILRSLRGIYRRLHKIDVEWGKNQLTDNIRLTKYNDSHCIVNVVIAMSSHFLASLRIQLLTWERFYSQQAQIIVCNHAISIIRTAEYHKLLQAYCRASWSLKWVNLPSIISGRLLNLS